MFGQTVLRLYTFTVWLILFATQTRIWAFRKKTKQQNWDRIDVSAGREVIELVYDTYGREIHTARRWQSALFVWMSGRDRRYANNIEDERWKCCICPDIVFILIVVVKAQRCALKLKIFVVLEVEGIYQ